MLLAFVLVGCTTAATEAPTPTGSETPLAVATATPEPTPNDSPSSSPTAVPSDTPSSAPSENAPTPVARSGGVAGDLAVICAGPCWPLTGKPMDGNAAIRPMAVRFDNALPAQPQAGLANADIVFDSVIESCVSRLLAVFQSRTAASVGSIRSARLYDVQLLPLFRGVLAHVGAADEVSQMIRDVAGRGDFVDIDAYKFGTYPAYTSAYHRVGWKSAPYNLYSSSASLRAAANSAPGGTAAVSVPDWGFLPAVSHDATAGGFASSAEGARFGFPSAGPGCPNGQSIGGYLTGYAPTYVYDAGLRGYRRSANGRTTVDESTGAAILARNVLVMYSDLSVTNIVESQGSWGVSYSIMPRTTGTGRLVAYRDGRKVEGTWSRAGDSSPFVLTNGDGERILLSPGQTWVHIVPTYWNVQ